jgi:hypothetical protein
LEYAIVSLSGVIESGPLTSHSSLPQKAKLITLTQALQLEANKTVKIYTNCAYTFYVVFTLGAI